MRRKHVALACALSLALGTLGGIYWHSQIVSRTVKQMKQDAKTTAHTEKELPALDSPHENTDYLK